MSCRTALLFVFVAFIMADAALNPAAARIKRSCNAEWVVTAGSGQASIATFWSRSSCPNSQPNKCRQRARDKAWRCLDAAMTIGSSLSTILLCSPDRVNGLSANERSLNIRSQALRLVCCTNQFGVNPTPAFLSVWGHTFGNKGCGYKNPFAPAQPGGDPRNLQGGTHTWRSSWIEYIHETPTLCAFWRPFICPAPPS